MKQTLIANLQKRKEEIKQNKKSDIVTGLVVHCGGMKGVYAMSALDALFELGFGDSFDYAAGTSSGAINAAYFLSGQTKEGVSAYLDDLSSTKFINFFRLGKVADIDFLVDEVIKKSKKLDVEKIKKSAGILKIIASEHSSLAEQSFSNIDNADFAEILRATSALPILYDRIVEVNKKFYIDGGISNRVPLLDLIESGCTDIVVILNGDLNNFLFRPSFPERIVTRIGAMLAKNCTKEILDKILEEDVLLKKNIEIIRNPKILNKDVRIMAIYPSDLKKMVYLHTTNRKKLAVCAEMGFNDAMDFFK